MLEIHELLSDSLKKSGDLQGGAGAGVPARKLQLEATLAKLQAKHQAVDYDHDSYLVKMGASASVRTLVLGWNHAAVLQRVGNAYVLCAIWCTGGAKWGGDLQANGALPNQQGQAAMLDGHAWRIYAPGAQYQIEQVITYGVTSCSFTVLWTYTPPQAIENDHSLVDRELMCISHINGAPGIPNVDILKALSKNWLVGFASIWPSWGEIKKYTQKTSNVTIKLLLRGKRPPPTQKVANASYYHADIGVDFANIDNPHLFGTCGFNKDSDYHELTGFTDGRFSRLRAFGTVESIKECRMFRLNGSAWQQAAQPDQNALVTTFAREGYPLVKPLTIVNTNSDTYSITEAGQAAKSPIIHRTPAGGQNYDYWTYCRTEEGDILREVVIPMLNGDLGFQEIHVEMYYVVRSLLAKRVPNHPSFFKDPVQTFEVLVWERYQALKNNDMNKGLLLNFARMLGNFYCAAKPANHPYCADIEAVMKKYSYRMDIPFSRFSKLGTIG